MIKKLGLLIVSCLFIFGIYNVYKNGLTIGSIDAINYQTIKNRNDTLNTKISELDKLNKEKYKNEGNTKLQSAQSQFNKAKTTYDTLAASASQSEIAEANKREEYLLDYLWIKIGNYANANNIKVLIDPNSQMPTVDFDVSGPYISVINFIYDLENDKELNFNIDNITMQATNNQSNVKAYFSVTGVNIITSKN